MKIINYISTIAIPAIILIIIFYSVLEKNKVYDIFIDGAKEGTKIVYNMKEEMKNKEDLNKWIFQKEGIEKK